MLYSVLLFGVLDIAHLINFVPRTFLYNSWAGTLAVAGILIAVFVYGNINYNKKERIAITLDNDKPVKTSLRAVMISDLHLGYHNKRAELARWIDMIKQEKPDVVLIAGDIIDGNLRPLMVEKSAEEFKRLGVPVFAILGNHEYIGTYTLSNKTE